MEVACVPPSSMHPKIELSVLGPPPFPGCHLDVTLRLDDGIFLDVYELGDLWGPGTESGDDSGPISMQWWIIPAVLDLERPAYFPVTTFTGEKAELRVMVPSSRLRKRDERHILDIPAHGRYQPTRTDGRTRRLYTLGAAAIDSKQADGEISAGWVCKAANGSWVRHGLDITGEVESSCFLPVGDARRALVVETGTLVAIGVAWVWLMYRLYLVMRTPGAKTLKVD